MYPFKLFAAIIIGVLLSLRDIREGKILNRDVLLVFLAGTALSLLETDAISLEGFSISLFLSILVGFAFWKMGLWSAGDGKLFAAYSLFLPAQAYDLVFPSQFLLYNVFLISLVIWLPSVFLKTTLAQKKGAFEIAFGKNSVLNLVLMLFGVFWVLGKFFQFLGIDVLVFYLLAAFLLFYLIRIVFPTKLTLVLLAVAITRPFFDASVFSFGFAANFVLLVFGILFASWTGFLSHYVSFDLRMLRDLRIGDVPFGIVKKKGSKKDFDFNLFMRRHFGVRANSILASGFEKTDISKARGFKALVGGFVVKKRIAFVPLLSVALLVTILIGQDIFLYMLPEFYHLFFE